MSYVHLVTLIIKNIMRKSINISYVTLKWYCHVIKSSTGLKKFFFLKFFFFVYRIVLKAGRISPQTLIHHQEYHHNGDDTQHHCEYHHISEETGQMEMNPFNQLNLIFSTVYIRTNEQFWHLSMLYREPLYSDRCVRTHITNYRLEGASQT